MVVIKNGSGLLGLGTQKSAVSQEWINELGSFVACWCKFMKTKSYFNNYWVGVVKNEQGLKDRGTLKPGTSHKWFDELSRLIEWFLHADSNGIIFCSTLYLWHLNAGGPLQLYLARVFRKNSLCAKMTIKRVFLLTFKKFCHWYLLEMYLNKSWYCSEFDLTGSDLGFTTRFWISMTELFVTINSFMITEGNGNQLIYQWICDIQIIWKLSYLISLRIIVFELFEHWTMLIVFVFLVLIISKFYSRISKKTWLNLQLCW